MEAPSSAVIFSYDANEVQSGFITSSTRWNDVSVYTYLNNQNTSSQFLSPMSMEIENVYSNCFRKSLENKQEKNNNFLLNEVLTYLVFNEC